MKTIDKRKHIQLALIFVIGGCVYLTVSKIPALAKKPSKNYVPPIPYNNSEIGLGAESGYKMTCYFNKDGQMTSSIDSDGKKVIYNYKGGRPISRTTD